MSFFIDILLVIPISIIFYSLIQIISDYSVKDKLYTEKRNIKFMILFITGLFSVMSSYKAIPRSDILNIIPVKYGLLGAGLCLTINSTISYWYEMDYKTKIFVLSVFLISTILISVQFHNDPITEYKEKKDKNKNKNKEEDIYKQIEEELGELT